VKEAQTVIATLVDREGTDREQNVAHLICLLLEMSQEPTWSTCSAGKNGNCALSGRAAVIKCTPERTGERS
jgi:hypothetical protein